MGYTEQFLQYQSVVLFPFLSRSKRSDEFFMLMSKDFDRKNIITFKKKYAVLFKA